PLDERTGERLARLLARQPERFAPDRQFAVRDRAVYVPRLRRVALAGGADRPFAEPSQLVVAGRVTAGVTCAVRQLLDDGSCDRVTVGLPSRSDADNETVSVLEAELTAMGNAIEVLDYDLADRPSLDRVLAALDADRPISVLYSLDVPGGGAVPDLDPAATGRRIEEAVDEVYALHEATRDRAVADFLLFGSFAAETGDPGNAEASALHAYLGALRDLRRAQGLPCLLIAWGPGFDEDRWHSPGTAHGDGRRDATQGRPEGAPGGDPGTGLTALAPEAAAGLLPRLSRDDGRTCVVLDADWPALAARALTSLPHGALFAELPEVRPLMPADAAADRGREESAGRQAEELLRKLSGLSDAEREQALVSLICAAAAEVLGYTSADQVDAGLSFLEMGVTSFTGLELRNLIATSTGLELPPVLVFDFPTPLELAGYLCTEMRPAQN
ncbi:MAG: KR domain-containing protein, partial [Streptomyces sp.]|nr:KR domain-containing protein [Streptomyces sp.]